jgi:opacity protein-like surface antigen
VPNGFSRDDTKRVFSHTVGVQFEPIPQVVIKGDYRNRNPKGGKIANEINVGIGYVF